MLIVEIQHANPYYDDSYAVNSANLGPYGDAITYELIPYIEKTFPRHRPRVGPLHVRRLDRRLGSARGPGFLPRRVRGLTGRRRPSLRSDGRRASDRFVPTYTWSSDPPIYQDSRDPGGGRHRRSPPARALDCGRTRARQGRRRPRSRHGDRARGRGGRSRRFLARHAGMESRTPFLPGIPSAPTTLGHVEHHAAEEMKPPPQELVLGVPRALGRPPPAGYPAQRPFFHRYGRGRVPETDLGVQRRPGASASIRARSGRPHYCREHTSSRLARTCSHPSSSRTRPVRPGRATPRTARSASWRRLGRPVKLRSKRSTWCRGLPGRSPTCTGPPASGEMVAVKIQRPEANTLNRQDLALLEFFARKVEARDRIDLPAVFKPPSTSLLKSAISGWRPATPNACAARSPTSRVWRFPRSTRTFPPPVCSSCRTYEAARRRNPGGSSGARSEAADRVLLQADPGRPVLSNKSPPRQPHVAACRGASQLLDLARSGGRPGLREVMTLLGSPLAADADS